MASKGINLLRLGREQEGVAALEAAYENDPYNIWAVNTLRLVDSFDRFESFETDHFSVRLHRDEVVALRAYVEDLLESCLDTLEERYDHQIEKQIAFEMYPDHEDFVVRALGLPGLGALGATFGNVVAMDSPSARPDGEFHWASTLWHEVAHVVTLSLSNNRVPRWFTEGLSMMEERAAGRGWGEDLSLAFVRAYESGDLLPLKELNSGFLRPKSPEGLAVSYYQAGWVCELLRKEFGMPRIRQMLVAFGEGRTTEEVFSTVLDKTPDEVDQLFQKELAAVLGPMESRLALPEATPSEPDQLRDAVRAQPENYFLNLALGHRLVEAGETSEAIGYLKKAVELFPSLTSRDSPYPILAFLYRQENRSEEEIEIRSQWWERAPLFINNALRLAELLESADRVDEAVKLLEEAMYVEPFSQEAHTQLGRLYLDRGDASKAVREYRAVLGLKPANQAQAHFQLANALSRAGERAAAKREVLLALENAPGWEQAQRLLLELVRQ
jgi:tetratricopeptide (TPR) repeat protein